MAHARAARSRIVEIAWKDRTPLEAIEAEYGLNEAAVIIFIRTHLKHRTFKRWRKRVSGRETDTTNKKPVGQSRALLCTIQTKAE
jgi:uncharacterized protein (TIGR03643 family)